MEPRPQSSPGGPRAGESPPYMWSCGPRPSSRDGEELQGLLEESRLHSLPGGFG